MSGALRARAVTDAADELASWSPEGLADVFITLRELPDLLGAIGEALSVVAIVTEESRTVHHQPVAAIEEAARWTAIAADGLGTEFARWSMLRGGTRWLPRGAA